jgi:hypothetical protein
MHGSNEYPNYESSLVGHIWERCNDALKARPLPGRRIAANTGHWLTLSHGHSNGGSAQTTDPWCAEAWFKRYCSRVTPKIDGALLATTFRDSRVTLV